MNKEVVSEMFSGISNEPHVLINPTSADEEAVNKVAEKIDTLRLGPRQVRMLLIRNE